MSIKEFCLIPRSDVKTKSKLYKPTSLVSLPQEKKKLKNYNPASNENDFDDAIKILLKPTEIQYADGIISYLRKQPLMRWDSSGTILSPIRGIKLIDLIQYLVSDKSTFDSSKIPDLRMMVKLIDLPEAYVRNKKARKQLYDTLPSVKPKPKWEPY